MKRLLLILTTASAVGLSSLAFADEAVVAEGLFREGRELLDAGKLDEACFKLRESDRVQPAPGTRFFLADCEERRGRIATAWATYGEVGGRLPPTDPRLETVKERIAALEPRVPRIVLKLREGSPASTTVDHGDVTLGRASFPATVPMDPGAQTLVVKAPGFAPREVTIDVAEGDRKEVVLSVGEALPQDKLEQAAQGATKQVPEQPDRSETGLGTQRIAGIVGGVVGVVTLGIGGGFGIASIVKNGDAKEICPEPNPCGDQAGVDAWNAATTYGDVATGMIVAGGVVAAAGLIVILTAPSTDSKSENAAWRFGTRGLELAF